MKQLAWSRLNHLQLGRYAEYFVKMQFTLLPHCQVFTAEVDDRGIDFVVRQDPGRYWDVQVKSARNWNYIFVKKSILVPRDNLLLAAAYFKDGVEPILYLIPSTAWLKPSGPLVSRDYEGKLSPPEFGVQLSKRNRESFEQYRFSVVSEKLFGASENAVS